MRSKGSSQALRRPNSHENTKSSVLHKEYLHFTVTKHSILHLISPSCGPKIHVEPPSNPLFGFGCPSVPSSKPQQTLDQMHNASPWLIQCDQTCQTSLDFSRSLVFNPMQRVSVAVFWSPNGSSPPFCHPQTMESSVFLRENQWLALRSGQR